MRYIPVVILLIIISSCTPKEKAKVIYGRLKNAENSWVYLQKISDKGDETIDSVQASSDGSFEMKNPATSADFYILRTNPTNVIFLVLKENERVEVTGDAKNLELTYKTRGSKD